MRWLGHLRSGADSIGLYKCKSNDKNSVWTTTSEQAGSTAKRFACPRELREGRHGMQL